MRYVTAFAVSVRQGNPNPNPEPNPNPNSSPSPNPSPNPRALTLTPTLTITITPNQVRQIDAPDPATLKPAVRLLLGGGVQLGQITVTVTNTSYTASTARRHLGAAPTPAAAVATSVGSSTLAAAAEPAAALVAGRRLGVTNATAPSDWVVSVQVAFEGIGEARDAAKRLQAAMPDPNPNPDPSPNTDPNPNPDPSPEYPNPTS